MQADSSASWSAASVFCGVAGSKTTPEPRRPLLLLELDALTLGLVGQLTGSKAVQAHGHQLQELTEVGEE